MTEVRNDASDSSSIEAIQVDPKLVEYYLERIRITPDEKLAQELASERQKLEAEKAEAEETSRIDSLTGLGNRRLHDEELSRAVEAAISTGRPFSVTFADIDHFKIINDNHEGKHQAGDAVLKTVAQALVNSTKRGIDRSFRYGGEEMVTILPVDLEAAIGVAERQRRNAEQATAHFNGEDIKVTISLGISCFDPKEVPLLTSLDPNDHAKNKQIVDIVVQEATKRIILEADTAMYEAKKAGRNMVALKEKGSDTVGIMKRDPQNPRNTSMDRVPFVPNAKSG